MKKMCSLCAIREGIHAWGWLRLKQFICDVCYEHKLRIKAARVNNLRHLIAKLKIEMDEEDENASETSPS